MAARMAAVFYLQGTMRQIDNIFLAIHHKKPSYSKQVLKMLWNSGNVVPMSHHENEDELTFYKLEFSRCKTEKQKAIFSKFTSIIIEHYWNIDTVSGDGTTTWIQLVIPDIYWYWTIGLCPTYVTFQQLLTWDKSLIHLDFNMNILNTFWILTHQI